MPSLSSPPFDLGVLWDLDGTLVDTEPIYYRAYASVASSLGASSPWTDADHASLLLGRPAPAGASAFLAALRARGPLLGDGGACAATPASVLAARDERTRAAFAQCELMPGAGAAVAACAARGLRQALATSAARGSAALKVARHAALAPLLAAGVCSDDAAMAGRPGKPAPDIFLAAAAALGLPATRCAAVEDSLAGMRAARAAGCFVIAVPDARLAAADVAAAGPDIVIRSLEHFSLDMITVEARVAALRKEALLAGDGGAGVGGAAAAPLAPPPPSSAPPVRLFFYGSLRAGKCNHGFLAKRLRRCALVGGATTVDADFRLVGLASRAFPYLTRAAPPPGVAAPAPTRVAGEVYEADADDAEGLAHLDDLEWGYAKRDIAVLVDGEAAPSQATVYLLEDGETLATLWAGLASGAFACVPSGDWGPVGQ